MLRSSGHGLNRHRSVGRAASSGIETRTLGIVNLPPQDVQFTQSTIHLTFSDGRRVLDTICGLQDHTVSPEELPKIRVARKSTESAFFSVDNRRLFAFQVARIPEISAVEIRWSSEFENKLAQRPRPHSDCVSTDSLSIEKWRTIANASRSSNIDELLSRRNGGRLSQIMLSSTLQGDESSSAKKRRQDTAHTVNCEARTVTRDFQQTSFSVSRSPRPILRGLRSPSRQTSSRRAQRSETWEIEGCGCGSFFGCEDCGRSYQSSP